MLLRVRNIIRYTSELLERNLFKWFLQSEGKQAVDILTASRESVFSLLLGSIFVYLLMRMINYLLFSILSMEIGHEALFKERHKLYLTSR
jgi:hypothetical protein